MRVAVAAALLTVTLCACRSLPAHFVRVYVTNEMSGDLSIVDAAAGTLIDNVPLGKRPRGIKAHPDGRLLYVALSGSPVGGPGVERESLPPADRSADGHDLYVSAGSFGAIFFIDPKANTAGPPLPVGQRPWGIALLPDGATLYTANGPSNDVSVVDVPSRTVLKRIRVGDRPWGVTVVTR